MSQVENQTVNNDWWTEVEMLAHISVIVKSIGYNENPKTLDNPPQRLNRHQTKIAILITD